MLGTSNKCSYHPRFLFLNIPSIVKCHTTTECWQILNHHALLGVHAQHFLIRIHLPDLLILPFDCALKIAAISVMVPLRYICWFWSKCKEGYIMWTILKRHLDFSNYYTDGTCLPSVFRTNIFMSIVLMCFPPIAWN